MQNIIDETCEIVQYADDIFIFVEDKFVNTAKQRLENNTAKLVEYFESHRLNLNEDKTEFIVFCKISQNKLTNNFKLLVKNHSTSLSSQSFCKVSWSLLRPKSNLRKGSKTCLEENCLWY